MVITHYSIEAHNLYSNCHFSLYFFFALGCCVVAVVVSTVALAFLFI